MSWPAPQDYNEAVQSPNLCFSDPELRGGTPTLTPLGLPKPISGNFASVYQLTCGSRVWAVRCFLHEFRDNEKRYQAISDHLRRSNLPSTVGFEFLRNGIRIRGMWYPVLKMEWVSGDPLNSYIEANLGRPVALHSLARQWIEVLSRLRREGVAHGDLQHGNILVSQGQIKLIDYDGLFVPALSGLTSHETGHRNYQHPARSGKEFGPYLDAFPGWVILVSLSALAVDPRLWRSLNCGDECLLFRREDFDHPNQSRAFQAMARSHSPEVRALGSYLQSLLLTPLGQIPPVDSSSGKATYVQPVSTSGLPNWLEHSQHREPDFRVPAQLAGGEPVPLPEGIGADWLVDHLAGRLPVTSVWQGVTVFADRLALLSAAIAALLIIVVCITAGVPFLASVCVLPLSIGLQALFLVARYRALPCHASQRIACSELSKSRDRVAAIERSMKAIKLEIDRLPEPLRDIQSQFRQLQAHYQDAEGQGIAQFNADIAENDRLARRADEEEAEEDRGSEYRFQQQAIGLSQQRNQLASDEQNELSQALRAIRDNHIRTCMAAKSVTGARITGIGEMLKARLQAGGIWSAADVTNSNVRRVHGIGDAKARLIVGWATIERNRASASAPTSLAHDIHQQIVGKYQATRRSLGLQIDAIGRQKTAEKQAIMDKYSGKRHELRTARVRIETANELARQSLAAQFEKAKQNLSGRFDELKQQITKMRQAKERKQQEGSRVLFQAKIKVSTMEREVMRYEKLSFMQFVRYVASLRRS